MQKLRTLASLDVSAVAGHHAMPAALLFFIGMGRLLLHLAFYYYSLVLSIVNILKLGTPIIKVIFKKNGTRRFYTKGRVKKM